MLENHYRDFKNPMILSNFLRETYNKEKDINKEMENEHMLRNTIKLIKQITDWTNNTSEINLLKLVQAIISCEEQGENTYFKEFKNTRFFSGFVELLVGRKQSFTCREVYLIRYFLKQFKNQSQCNFAIMDEFLEMPVWPSDFENVTEFKRYYTDNIKPYFQ